MTSGPASRIASDQYSQVEVTSTQLTGGQWIGPAVRAQNGGQNTYLGIYFWNSGSPVLRLYKRSAGNWTQLGSSYNSGPLAAGTQLKLTAVGSRISFLQDGVERIAVTDTSLTGGAPGIMAYGTSESRQLVRRNRHRLEHVFDRRHRFGAVGDGGVAGQRRRRSQRQRQRPVHVQHLAGHGAAYSVTVKTNPSGQTCTVSGGSGTVASANVTNVAVACTGSSTTPGVG